VKRDVKKMEKLKGIVSSSKLWILMMEAETGL
jgi:hypothetical protein